MIWLPKRYLGLVRKIEISPFLQSDHQCVHLEINFPWGDEKVLGCGSLTFRYAKTRPSALGSMTAGAAGASRTEGFPFSHIGTKQVKCACASV